MRKQKWNFVRNKESIVLKAMLSFFSIGTFYKLDTQLSLPANMGLSLKKQFHRLLLLLFLRSNLLQARRGTLHTERLLKFQLRTDKFQKPIFSIWNLEFENLIFYF